MPRRFRGSDITLGVEGDDGRLYAVALPDGPPGFVFVSARAAGALGDRLTPTLVARALNDLVERHDASHALHVLRREGGVELAPDGLIDDG